MSSPLKKKSINSVEFRSILRIRPLLGKERDDQVVLEPLEDGLSVALHPPVMKDGEATFLNALVSGQDLEFRFDRVLSKNTNQEKTYSVVAQPMALLAMEPFKHLSELPPDTKSCTKNQLLVCMGLPNSGSSFTCTGPISKRKKDTDGLIPRLLESLFLQSQHIVTTSSHKSITFGVNFTAIQVNQSKINSHECHLYDLVKSESKSNSFASAFVQSKSALVETDANKHRGDMEVASGTDTNALSVFCSSVSFARDCLKLALQRGRQTSQKKFQSHFFISIQPLFVSQHSGRILSKGGSINFLEMAGFDSKQRATRTRDPSCSDAHTAILHCLKAIRHNQASINGHRKIPFLQHKVTALLMPYLSSKENSNLSVTLLVTASPSIRDYSDKKMLLSDVLQLHIPSPSIDVLTGISSESNVGTLNTASRNLPTIRQGFSEEKWSNKSKSKCSKMLPEECPENPKALPPPIVPSFIERKDDLIDSCRAEASAPIEPLDCTESANSPVADVVCAPKSISLRANDESVDAIDLLAESRFKYLKTINMVVHASKKKGLDIMKNITVTTVNREPSSHSEQRVLELEKQTQHLLFEIHELKRRNRELEDCIQQKSEVFPTNRAAVVSNCNDISSGYTKGSETGCDCADEETFGRSPESSVGSNETALFKYMANLSDEHIKLDKKITVGNDSQKMSRVGDGIETEYDENEADHDTSNVETSTFFDDPLLQHMAMLSSYR